VSQKKCRQAYEARLATWAASRSPPLRIEYENVPFVPVTGATYLRASALPARTTSPDLAGDMAVFQGVFQVLVVSPINIGSGVALGIADELDALFPVNQRLSISSFVVQQTTPVSLAPALPDANSFIVPVSFEYRADN
jgi:hypothetical protein